MRSPPGPLDDPSTIDDNSTLTSFTNLWQQPIRNGMETNLLSYRSRSNDDGDKENSQTHPISSPHSLRQFWTALSAHAASAAITSSASSSSGNSSRDNNNPDKVPVAAARAAANSLLEDGRAMERINVQRVKQKQQLSSSGRGNQTGSKPLVRVTHQTVRSAATKASIAVLQTGANQEVATAVSSTILREGECMVSGKSKKKENSVSTSVETSSSKSGGKSTNNSSTAGSNSSSRSSKSSSYARNIVESLLDDHYNRKREQLDDVTIPSISTEKFGKDKYATKDTDSVTLRSSSSVLSSSVATSVLTELREDEDESRGDDLLHDCRRQGETHDGNTTTIRTDSHQMLQPTTVFDANVSDRIDQQQQQSYDIHKINEARKLREINNSTANLREGHNFFGGEQLLKQKEANLLQAMELLKQKLNELESCTSSGSSSAHLSGTQMPSGTGQLISKEVLLMKLLTDNAAQKHFPTGRSNHLASPPIQYQDGSPYKQMQQLTMELDQLSTITNPTIVSDLNNRFSSGPNRPNQSPVPEMNTRGYNEFESVNCATRSVGNNGLWGGIQRSSPGENGIPHGQHSNVNDSRAKNVKRSNFVPKTSEGHSIVPSSLRHAGHSVHEKQSVCFPIEEHREMSVESQMFSNNNATSITSMIDGEVQSIDTPGMNPGDCDMKFPPVKATEEEAHESIEVIYYTESTQPTKPKSKFKDFFRQAPKNDSRSSQKKTKDATCRATTSNSMTGEPCDSSTSHSATTCRRSNRGDLFLTKFGRRLNKKRPKMREATKRSSQNIASNNISLGADTNGNNRGETTQLHHSKTLHSRLQGVKSLSTSYTEATGDSGSLDESMGAEFDLCAGDQQRSALFSDMMKALPAYLGNKVSAETMLDTCAIGALKNLNTNPLRGVNSEGDSDNGSDMIGNLNSWNVIFAVNDDDDNATVVSSVAGYNFL